MALQMPRVSWNSEQFSALEKQRSFDNQFILRLIASYDSVFFDFSDWTVEELNENTSAFFGVPQGSLTINWCNLQNGAQANITDEMHNTTIDADSSDSEPSRDIVAIHDWCVEQAQLAGTYRSGQRAFRFKSGKYVGSLPLPGLRVAGKPKPGNCNPM